MPHDPPDFAAANRAKRREEERMRAEYFAKGGKITRYPMNMHGKYRISFKGVVERKKEGS